MLRECNDGEYSKLAAREGRLIARILLVFIVGIREVILFSGGLEKEKTVLHVAFEEEPWGRSGSEELRIGVG